MGQRHRLTGMADLADPVPSTRWGVLLAASYTARRPILGWSGPDDPTTDPYTALLLEWEPPSVVAAALRHSTARIGQAAARTLALSDEQARWILHSGETFHHAGLLANVRVGVQWVERAHMLRPSMYAPAVVKNPVWAAEHLSTPIGDTDRSRLNAVVAAAIRPLSLTGVQYNSNDQSTAVAVSRNPYTHPSRLAALARLFTEPDGPAAMYWTPSITSPTTVILGLADNPNLPADLTRRICGGGLRGSAGHDPQHYGWSAMHPHLPADLLEPARAALAAGRLPAESGLLANPQLTVGELETAITLTRDADTASKLSANPNITVAQQRRLASRWPTSSASWKLIRCGDWEYVATRTPAQYTSGLTAFIADGPDLTPDQVELACRLIAGPLADARLTTIVEAARNL